MRKPMRKRSSRKPPVLEQEQLANSLTTSLVQYSKSRHQQHLPSWEVRIHIAVQGITHCKCVTCLQYSHSPSPSQCYLWKQVALLKQSFLPYKQCLPHRKHPPQYKLINSFPCWVFGIDGIGVLFPPKILFYVSPPTQKYNWWKSKHALAKIIRKVSML